MAATHSETLRSDDLTRPSHQEHVRALAARGGSPAGCAARICGHGLGERSRWTGGTSSMTNDRAWAPKPSPHFSPRDERSTRPARLVRRGRQGRTSGTAKLAVASSSAVLFCSTQSTSSLPARCPRRRTHIQCSLESCTSYRGAIAGFRRFSCHPRRKEHCPPDYACGL